MKNRWKKGKEGGKTSWNGFFRRWVKTRFCETNLWWGIFVRGNQKPSAQQTIKGRATLKWESWKHETSKRKDIKSAYISYKFDGYLTEIQAVCRMMNSLLFWTELVFYEKKNIYSLLYVYVHVWGYSGSYLLLWGRSVCTVFVVYRNHSVTSQVACC